MFAPALGTSGRLTTELILRSPQYMNACSEYEIDLRGNKISAIENLGGTENQFDSIDLSDNEIVKLEGFPLLPKLKTLLLNNNRVMRISKNLEASIPNVETLVLTGNRLTNITDIQNLSGLKNLKRLVVIGNGIAKLPGYRLRIIHALPQLKMLDFQKVKLKERQKAESSGGQGMGAEEDAAMEDAPQDATMEAPAKKKPVDVTAIKAAIASATTIEEVQKLEAALLNA
mmetsp:Transcript_8140/g.16588  ORF Transcript_8140/g.16588 Transcript_8140/m.16588 type:complete len:229 (-) Transcript_8140:100-786(-)